MTIFRSEELAHAFIQECLESRALFDAGDVAASNKAFDRSRKIAAQLMSDHGAREACLRQLADHGDSVVALNAAAYLLAVDEDFAISRLEHLATSAGFPDNISARTCVSEWRAGNMNDIRALA